MEIWLEINKVLLYVTMRAEFAMSAFVFKAKLRLEMEMERLRQTHSKEIESKDDEVEEIRQSCSKKVRRSMKHFSTVEDK